MQETIHNSEWIRMLSTMEEMLYHCHNMGRMIIRYSIRLCSRNPLVEEQVRTAAIHLQRKVPTLRLCIRSKEDGKFWFLTRDNEAVDFQIGDAANYDTEHKDILYHRFNISNGPLWRLRLFPCLPDEPFHIEHLRVEYLHQYNLLFGFQHSITDGTSNIKICDLFLSILNDVISGKVINDDEQLGNHISDIEVNEILEEVNSMLTKDENELELLHSFYECVKTLELPIISLYPSDFPNIPSTETIYYDMSEDETNFFLSKCKTEGVTVNSALCTAIHAAIVDLLKKTGLESDSFSVAHLQLVNIRRYLKEAREFPIGHCVGTAAMVSLVPANIDNVDTFWKMASVFNDEISNVIQNKLVYKQMIVNSMGGSKDLKNITSEDSSDRLNYTYVTSNCGNLNSLFNGLGEHVQATHLKRCTSLTKLVSLHECHTFRGRLHYSLVYGQEYMSRNGAQLWCDSIFKILQQVVHV